MVDAPTQSFVRDIDILYRMGTVGGLTDRELLRHFTMRDKVLAQQAFEAIVQRHGPMVLGVCHRFLRDRHAAEDAFQATFLALAPRPTRSASGMPWAPGCMASRPGSAGGRGSWLTVGESKALAANRAFCLPEGSEVEAAEVRSVLDEEIDRLPAAYRRAIVLCYLEGKTQEDAARELGCARGRFRAGSRGPRACFAIG